MGARVLDALRRRWEQTRRLCEDSARTVEEAREVVAEARNVVHTVVLQRALREMLNARDKKAKRA